MSKRTLLGAVGRNERPIKDTDERDEFLRQQRLHTARRSQWEELDRADLEFGRYWVEHRDGRRFKVVHGLLDAQFSPVIAYALTEDGPDVIALEEMR